MTTAAELRTMHRAAMRSEILDSARAQVTETGEVSFREVARQLGMTAPGLYRYFPALGALEDAIAREIAMAAMVSINGAGFGAYAEWAAANPMWFAFLAKHPKHLAEVHAVVEPQPDKQAVPA